MHSPHLTRVLVTDRRRTLLAAADAARLQRRGTAALQPTPCAEHRRSRPRLRVYVKTVGC